MVYEFEFAIYVEANDPHDAMEKVGAVLDALNALDIENDAAIEGPTERNDLQS